MANKQRYEEKENVNVAWEKTELEYFRSFLNPGEAFTHWLQKAARYYAKHLERQAAKAED